MQSPRLETVNGLAISADHPHPIFGARIPNCDAPPVDSQQTKSTCAFTLTAARLGPPRGYRCIGRRSRRRSRGCSKRPVEAFAAGERAAMEGPSAATRGWTCCKPMRAMPTRFGINAGAGLL